MSHEIVVDSAGEVAAPADEAAAALTPRMVELLSRLLSRRTEPGSGHLIWSEADYDDSVRRLLHLTGHGGRLSDEAQRSVLTLRNELVHTEISSPGLVVLASCLAADEAEVRRKAATQLAEVAARKLEDAWSRVRLQVEDLTPEFRPRRDDVGLAIAASVADSFVEQLTAAAELLGKLDDEEAARLGRRAAAQVLASARWSQVVGDRLDTTQVTQLLGVTRQALAKRQSTGSLLGLPGDGTTWYPTWQFDIDAARIRPEVRDLIGAFRDRIDDVDPLVVAAWVTTPQDEDLAGETPAQWLRAGRDADQLRRAAERAAGRLAR